jgi:N-acetylglucosaminyldiphosphoundecaprenol N-acetyl-beta-D-mannosaminyltransferase
MTDHKTSRFRLLGIPIDPYTYDEWLDQIGGWVGGDDNRLHHVCTLNPEFVVIAQHDPQFFNVLNQADACVADGTGIMIAARILGEPLPSRITGSDGIYQIARRATSEGWRLFLLGAAAGVAEKVANILQNQFDGLYIAGTYAGNPADSESEAIIGLINASGADILLVAYGAPKQDLWIYQHREHLNVRMAMGVGGAFDYVVGNVPRAPRWMRQLGFEWLYRLIKQPWRWRRMMRLPIFVWLVLRYREKPSTSRCGFKTDV